MKLHSSPNIFYRIHNILYTQAVDSDIKAGDLVIDTKDGAYGVCDMIHEDGKHIAMKDNFVVELGIPIERVKKLIPVVENNSSN